MEHYDDFHKVQRCDWCGQNFSSLSHVLDHQRSACNSSKPGVEVMVNICVCPNCRKVFSRKTPPGCEPRCDICTRALCINCVSMKETEMKLKIQKIRKAMNEGQTEQSV